MKTPTHRHILAVAIGSLLAFNVQASSHREAPIVALDRAADITDFYAFVSPDAPDTVTLIMNVDPLLEPGNGPNYFPFDPEITYAIHIDNDHDARADLSLEFNFETEIRAPAVFTGFVGAGGGISAPANSPAPVPPGTPIVPPAITALEGPGSEGLSLRQRYTVTLARGDGFAARRTELGSGLLAVPSNAGPRTMPDYAGLASQGIHDIGGGDISVFAGTVDDPFFIDLGAAFDSLNFRPSAFGTGVPGVLDDTQDANDGGRYAPDEVAGYNVNSIAIRVPIAMLTADGEVHGADSPKATIGSWATTSRPRVKVFSNRPDRPANTSGRITAQIQRLGNPLINELIIGTGDKDTFSRSAPADDGQFADYFLDPLLARVLNTVYEATVAPGVLPIPAPPRSDLLPLVTYAPPIAAPGTPAGPVADMLRLNTGVAPTPFDQQSRLGLLAGQPDGFPNGRRLGDDVVDIAARAVVGVLAGGDFSGFPHNRVGDGVNANDRPFQASFPYLAYANSGRDGRHIDPGEPGCITPAGAPTDCPTD